ncbi:MAG: hypothetical protein C4554_07490 [Dethiobacter sp.]|jgi:Na+/melibiose symporter-like transporter|nr:MAG: hypothetical protein C4554_07490 [Dethiobacter sp.]
MVPVPRDYAESKPATLGLRQALVTTFKNRAFRIYLFGNVACWFGFNIISLGIPFYVTTLLGLIIFLHYPEDEVAALRSESSLTVD